MVIPYGRAVNRGAVAAAQCSCLDAHLLFHIYILQIKLSKPPQLVSYKEVNIHIQTEFLTAYIDTDSYRPTATEVCSVTRPQ